MAGIRVFRDLDSLPEFFPLRFDENVVGGDAVDPQTGEDSGRFQAFGRASLQG
jgi:hypothetical protein